MTRYVDDDRHWHYVSRQEILDFIRNALAVDPSDVRSVTIGPDEVDIELFERDFQGNKVVDIGGFGMATTWHTKFVVDVLPAINTEDE